MTSGRLVIIATGGTIASHLDVQGKWSLYRAAELLSLAPGIERLAHTSTEDMFRAPSARLSLDDMTQLVLRIRALVASEDVRGVVVTHGTDALEESAYLVDLLVDSPKPVVFTGAMRAASEYGTDGPRNLYAACLTALTPEARGEGTLVVLNDRVHSARDVTKLDSRNPGSFGSPPFGPLAYLEGNRIVWGRHRLSMPRFPRVTELEQRVDLIKLTAGMARTLVEAAVAGGARALVLETLGAGAVPPAALAPARRAARGGVHIVLTTRCLTGTVGPGAGRSSEFVFAGDLSGPKARLQAMVALAARAGEAALRDAFRQPGLHVHAVPPD